ncbi:MAG TPA: ethanolamine ammonia-lyase subunit EutB, partial [Myxococcota bacterium]
MRLSTTLFGESFTFTSVKDALARANEPRSGDQQAGLAPRSMREMAAAKRVVADLTLKDLREHPSVPYELDEVTRVVEDDLDQRAYKRVCGWSVAALREWILDDDTSGAE